MNLCIEIVHTDPEIFLRGREVSSGSRGGGIPQACKNRPKKMATKIWQLTFYVSYPLFQVSGSATGDTLNMEYEPLRSVAVFL